MKRTEYGELLAELAQLRAWKESAMAVETSLNAQEVARLLALPLGTAIHPQIVPGIRALQQKLVKLRTALVGIIGTDGEKELLVLLATLRVMPGPAADKAVSIAGITALIETLPGRSAEEGRG